jgi:DNA-directed RNA polymerase subunit K/omega
MGKYALVVSVAKRARELRDRMRGHADAAPATAITQALEEIAAHRVRIRKTEEEEDQEQESKAEQE